MDIENIEKITFKIEKNDDNKKPEKNTIIAKINNKNRKEAKSFLNNLLYSYKNNKVSYVYIYIYNENEAHIEFYLLKDKFTTSVSSIINNSEAYFYENPSHINYYNFDKIEKKVIDKIETIYVKKENIKKLLLDFFYTIFDIAKVTPESYIAVKSPDFYTIVIILNKTNINLMFNFDHKSDRKNIPLIITYIETSINIDNENENEIIININKKTTYIKLYKSSTYEEVSEKIKRILN